MIDMSLLSPEERISVRRAAKLELARVDFLRFCQYVMPDFETSWHHRLIARYLDAFVEGRITRLMIFAPPRHGKSQMVSRLLPAYLMGKIANPLVMTASYAAALARKMNVDVQRFMDTQEYKDVFPHIGLGAENVRTGSFKPKRNADYFEICEVDSETRRCGAIVGSYTCAGVGGPLTGMGATHAIIDDPVKDAKDADSVRMQSNKIDWYSSVLYTRLQTPGSILLMHTRWNEGDLAGRLLELMAKDPEADQWVVLNLPALVEEGMTLHPEDKRVLGEALWESRFPPERLRKIKASIGPRWWNALYGGEPSELTGNIYRKSWINYYDDISEFGGYDAFEHIGFSLDLTFDEGEKADFVSIQVLGKTRVNIAKGMPSVYVLIDQERAQVDFVDSMILLDMIRVRNPGVVHMFVEAKANGAALLSILKKSPAGKGLRLRAITPTANKTLRYYAAAPIVEQGRFYVPRRAHWLPEYLKEFCKVPLAANDDQADATVQYILELETGGKVDPLERLRKLKLITG